MEAGGANGASGDGAPRVLRRSDGSGPRVQSERMPDGKPVAVGDAPVGGQAVLEGVMMRGVSVWAVACRTPEGRIDITTEPIVSWAKRSRIWRLPVIRGVVALAESLVADAEPSRRGRRPGARLLASVGDTADL